MEKKRIVLIDTNYPINSRNKRIVNSLSKEFGVENVRVIAWDRCGNIEEGATREFYNIYNHPSPLGDKWAKLRSLVGYGVFVKRIIKEFTPNVIIASHWDSLLIASLIKNTNQILIYENLDMPSGKQPLRRILTKIEHMALRNTDAISYASRFYLPYYNFFKGQHIILENKLAKEALVELSDREIPKKGPLRIMFNGAIRYAETMHNLFEAIGGNENIELLIYGYPVGSEGQSILRDAGRFKNILYLGSYVYTDIPKLYAQSDLVWGVYTAKDFNVKNAISNKFHESIAYVVPGIFAANTKLGDLVANNEIGFTVDGYSITAIKTLFEEILDDRSKILVRIKSNLKSLRDKIQIDWDSEFLAFKNYIINS